MLSKDEITARSLRLSGRAPNPYTGTLNDPLQEAQSRYAGLGWAQFFGGLQKNEEDANLAGKHFRVGWSGFGNATEDAGGGAVPRGRGPSLAAMTASPVSGFMTNRPGDEDIARSWASNTALSDLVDEQRKRDLENRLLSTHASLAELGLQQAQGAEADQAAMDRNLAPPPEPTLITRTTGVTPLADAYQGQRVPDTITARPAGPVSARDRLLAAVPGHLRPGLEKTLAEMDFKKQASELAAREQTVKEGQLAETIRKDRATEAQNAPFTAPKDASGTPLTGDALLQTLPLAKQKLVQSVLEGRQALPSGSALKDPYWKGVIETANLVDPNFDTVNFNARANTRKDFTSGKAAGQVNAINTVIGHLHDLAATGSQLGNTGLDWVNSIYNALTPGGTKRGVNLNNFNTLKEGVATELMRTWRQVGAGSEKEIEDWKGTITAAKSPEELQGAFKTVGGMLESKLGALDNQYKQGMGTDKVSAITPESRTRLDALQGLGTSTAAPTRKNPFRK